MNNYRRRNSFKSRWLYRKLNQDRSLREKMVLFWHNHFVTESNNVDNAFFCYSYNNLLRQHALGNFRELTRAITTEPAMLRYLNGYANTKKAPDENYGRGARSCSPSAKARPALYRRRCQSRRPSPHRLYGRL